MIVSSYNPKVLGDILIIVTGANSLQQKYYQKDNIVQIVNDHQQVIGYNFFDVAHQLGLTEKDTGQVFLTKKQVQLLNHLLIMVGFKTLLKEDITPKFVVGLVQKIESHPHSDHLHICQVEVNDEQEEQIICGAPNVDQGQKVVVAKIGAMMPNGQIIFSGMLRGIRSNGMLCSARELGLDHASQQRGILILNDNYQVGSALDLQQLNKNFR